MWNLDFEQIENGQELVTLKAEYTYNLPACWLELSAAGTAPNSLKLERLRSVEETHSKRAHQLKVPTQRVLLEAAQFIWFWDPWALAASACGYWVVTNSDYWAGAKPN